MNIRPEFYFFFFMTLFMLGLGLIAEYLPKKLDKLALFLELLGPSILVLSIFFYPRGDDVYYTHVRYNYIATNDQGEVGIFAAFIMFIPILYLRPKKNKKK